MSRLSQIELLCGAAAAALICAGVAFGQDAARPDFSANNTGWVSIGTDYVALRGGPQPVTFDAAHRYVPNGSGEQPTFRVADLSNPNLTDFAKAELQEVQRHGAFRLCHVCARIPLLDDRRADICAQSRTTDLHPARAKEDHHDVANGSASAPRLS